MSDDDDGFVFGDDGDESLFGSSDTTAGDGDRRFGSNDGADSPSAGRSPFDSIPTTVATVVLVAALVAVAGAVAYPLVMDVFDTGGSTDGRVPSDGGGSGSVSTQATPTGPSTEIVVTVAPPTTNASEPNRSSTRATTRPARTTSTTASPVERTTTERSTVAVEEFPAGKPADENETPD